jgi:hypothetical protein
MPPNRSAHSGVCEKQHNVTEQILNSVEDNYKSLSYSSNIPLWMRPGDVDNENTQD